MGKSKEIFKYQSVVDAIVAKLLELPEDTETSTSQMMEMLYGKMDFTEREYDYRAVAFTLEEYIEVDYQVRRLAKKAGLLLDDMLWAGMELGLPFHFSYLVKRQGGKRL